MQLQALPTEIRRPWLGKLRPDGTIGQTGWIYGFQDFMLAVPNSSSHPRLASVWARALLLPRNGGLVAFGSFRDLSEDLYDIAALPIGWNGVPLNMINIYRVTIPHGLVSRAAARDVVPRHDIKGAPNTAHVLANVTADISDPLVSGMTSITFDYDEVQGSVSNPRLFRVNNNGYGPGAGTEAVRV